MRFSRRHFLGLLGLSAAGGIGPKRLVAGPVALASIQPPPSSPLDYHHNTPAPDYADDTFDGWRSLSRLPITSGLCPLGTLLVEAIERTEPLYLNYCRDAVTVVRRVTPLHLFETENEWADYRTDELAPGHYPDDEEAKSYLSVWDHDRAAGRTFRLDRINLLVTAPWMVRHLPDEHQQAENLLATTAAWLTSLGVRPIPRASSEPVMPALAHAGTPFVVSMNTRHENAE